MKKTILIVLTLIVCQNLSTAQIQKEDVDIAQSLFNKKKKEVVRKYMDIQDNNTAFWSLYDEYEVKRNVIMKERFFLLKEYSEKYATIDDATATKLAKGFMESDFKSDKLNKKYFGKFEKLIGGLQATTFFQLEMYIQTSTQANLQSQIPIIGELQKITEMQIAPAGL